MNGQIGILHLSDIHACATTRSKLNKLMKCLVDDLQHLQLENGVDVDMVCISGDLINSGDNADEEIEIIFSELIQPLMETLGLNEERFFIVAGNHEIKRSTDFRARHCSTYLAR